MEKMKVLRGWKRTMMVAFPPALMLVMLIALSGGIGANAAVSGYGWADPLCWDGNAPIYSPFGTKSDGSDWWPAPNKCSTASGASDWAVNGNPVSDLLGNSAAGEPFDGFVDADQVQAMLASDTKGAGGQYNVKLIDVRVPEEQFDGIAPCLIAIGIAPFPISNSGHPVFKRDDGTWEESYHVPFFAGYYWAGTQRVPDSTKPDNAPLANGQFNTPVANEYWAPNIRPEPNPNFVALGYQDASGNEVVLGGYFQALVDQGEIVVPDPNDPNAEDLKLVIMCQSGWRATYAASVVKNLPVFADNPNVKVYDLYGGMRGWSGSFGATGFTSPDEPGAAYGGVLVDPNGNNGNGTCANQYLDPQTNNPVADMNNTFNCPEDKRLKVVPTYEHVTAAASDPMITDRYAYNTTRLVRDAQIPMWDGVETHVGQMPEWMVGFGAMDFMLKPGSLGPRAFWASKSDYQKGLLTVQYAILNDKKDYMGNTGSQLNYYDECGGAPAPEGQCQSVLYAPWGPAYNTKITSATANNGVTLAQTDMGSLNLLGLNLTLGGGNLATANGLGVILPGTQGISTVKYRIPMDPGTGKPMITSFTSSPIVQATDIIDPARSFFGAKFAFYFTHIYNNWSIDISVPQKAPLL